MSADPATTLPGHLRGDVEVLWAYHDMGHEPRPCDVAVGLGSHDLGVATHVATLYHRGLFPLVVFTGANAPTTVDRFPRGEAIHYRDHAIDLGVPADAILTEPHARNTGENIDLTRQLLADHDIKARSVLLVTRPYQQRRAYATATKRWPDVAVTCTSRPLPLDDYLAEIGDVDRVVDMLVGDTQRITEYARRGFTDPQPVPADVDAAFRRLVHAGYTSRLV